MKGGSRKQEKKSPDQPTNQQQVSSCVRMHHHTTTDHTHDNATRRMRSGLKPPSLITKLLLGFDKARKTASSTLISKPTMIIRSLGLASSVGYLARLRSLSGGSEATAELAPSPPPGGRLVSASIFFRHGARTPVFTTIPGLSSMGEWDVCTPQAVVALPHVVVFDLRDGGPRPPLSSGVQSQVDFALPTPPGFKAFAGQLSDLGVEQAVDLGRTLRATYAPHLDSALDDPRTQCGLNGIVKCRTTNVPRCVTSAQGVLHGLFGEVDRGSGDAVAENAAFPLYTLPTTSEYCTPNVKACLRLGEYFAAGKAQWAQSGGGDVGQSVLKDLKELLPPEVRVTCANIG